MKQKIIVTALPNGISTTIKGKSITTLKASAAISLQVETTDKPDTRLKDVTDMLNWAALIKGAKFLVQINGSITEAKVTSAAVDTELWKNLFFPTVKVVPFVQEPLHLTPIVSYPVKHILSYIKGVVEQTGKNFANDLPDTTFYTENPIFSQIADYLSVNEIPQKGRKKLTLEDMVTPTNAGRRYQDELMRNRFVAFSPQAQPFKDFAQLKNFHGLYNKPKQTAPHLDKPDFEFHDILSLLANYPQLLRKLGLVVDFEFAVPDDKIMLAADVNLRIIPTGINFSVPTSVVCPATAYTKTSIGFYAKPETNSAINKGYLKINSDAFTVFQLDTDGAALKLCQQVDALQLKKAKHIFYAYENNLTDKAAIPILNNELPRKEGLPSQRTTGIAIAKNGMAEKLNARLVRMNDLKTKMATGAAAPAGVSGSNATWVLPADVLTAEDVNLGYRMDIQVDDKPGTWFSLHKRTNSYSFLNSAGNGITIPGTDPDEGFLQTSASEETTDTGKQLKVGEAIARWEGWSLSVPRPGSALNDPLLDKDNEVYKSDSQQEKDKYKTDKTADFRLNVKPEIVKGSLPMLRFGKKYSMKIRTVDLAGNSVPLNTAPENAGECIKGGVKYMRYEPVDAPFLVPGNIIKDGESAQVMVIRSNEGVTTSQYENANLAKPGDKALASEAVRHVKPPRTTVEMATTHGMFDAGMGTANTTKAGTIYSDITPKRDPKFSNGDEMYEMKVVSGDDKNLTVEYLVDPMAIGVAFFLSNNDPNIKIPDPSVLDRWVSFYFDTLIPGDALNTPPAPTYDEWLNPKTFRIRLLEADFPKLEWENSSRTLKVFLQKGFMVKMNYACFWKPDALVKYSGVLDMMGMSSLSGEVGKKIGTGQHWMFSPWRELTFVHAVQQPITKLGAVVFPAVAEINVDRNYTESFATLNTKLLVHGPSTGQLDIEAKWKEPVDDIAVEITDAVIASPNQIDVANVAKVFHFTTLYPLFDYVFGDAAKVKNNPFPGIRHMFNDTKHRNVIYNTIATTRYKENFFNLIQQREKDKVDFPLTRKSADSVIVNVPSSARPAAPEIEYIIPTFEWDRVTKGSTILTGRASGLRIYLKRPWFSSGEGEQLAVVLGLPSNPALAGAIGSAGVPVTIWGTDPTKVSAPLPTNIILTQDAFLKGVKVPDGIPTAENEAARVIVVAFDVNLKKFDTERQLYYVDIMLNIGFAYYPFIKLALARYQKDSVTKENTDCCLSPIVVTDYVQIPAPRASSLETKGSKNNIVVAISGTVPNVSNAGSMFRTKVEFTIETIDVASTENIHIGFDNQPIDTYSYVLTEADIKNFAFYHSHPFTLPEQYAGRPYRVTVKEYEMIELDKLKPNPNPAGQFGASMPTKDRLVFADVYEVNK